MIGMRRLKIIIAYDGTDYFGWQQTGPQPSIQGALDRALTTITRQEVHVTGASRTDRGVHAEGQVAHFDVKWEGPLQGLQFTCNQLLPAAIRILTIDEVVPTFHATLDAQAKEYHYWIETAPVCDPHRARTCWHVPSDLNLEAMAKAAEQLVGQHDFATFCNQRSLWHKPTERSLLSCRILSEGSRLCLVVIGDQFLYKMVRNVAGTLVYIGRGKIQLEELDAIMEARHRPGAGMTAPAQGLILHRVEYDSTPTPSDLIPQIL